MAEDRVQPPRHTSTPLANRKTSNIFDNFMEVSPISTPEKGPINKAKSMIPLLTANQMRPRADGVRSIGSKTKVSTSTYLYYCTVSTERSSTQSKAPTAVPKAVSSKEPRNSVDEGFFPEDGDDLFQRHNHRLDHPNQLLVDSSSDSDSETWTPLLEGRFNRLTKCLRSIEDGPILKFMMVTLETLVQAIQDPPAEQMNEIQLSDHINKLVKEELNWKYFSEEENKRNIDENTEKAVKKPAQKRKSNDTTG